MLPLVQFLPQIGFRLCWAYRCSSNARKYSIFSPGDTDDEPGCFMGIFLYVPCRAASICAFYAFYCAGRFFALNSKGCNRCVVQRAVIYRRCVPLRRRKDRNLPTVFWPFLYGVSPFTLACGIYRGRYHGIYRGRYHGI